MRAATIAFLGLFLASPGFAGDRDTFAILSEDATETSRVVSVRIGQRMSDEDLVRLAGIVKAAKASPSLRNTVVSFYLPAMPQNQRPWASVDLAPTPKVHIGGLRIEDERAYVAEVNADRRALTGAWLTELPAAPGRITTFTDKGRAYLETVTRGGQKTVEEVVETRDQRGTRYDLKSGGGDFYVLKASGELELRNPDRLLAVAERITLHRHAADTVAHAVPSSPPPADTGAAAAMAESANEPSRPSSAISFALPSAEATLTETAAAPIDPAPPVVGLPAAMRKKRVVRRAPVRKPTDTAVFHDVMNIRYQR